MLCIHVCIRTDPKRILSRWIIKCPYEFVQVVMELVLESTLDDSEIGLRDCEISPCFDFK